jgi:hypothetical protein
MQSEKPFNEKFMKKHLKKAKEIKRFNEIWIVFDLSLATVDIILSYLIIDIVILDLMFIAMAIAFVILSINHWKIRKRIIQVIRSIEEVNAVDGMES